MIGSDDCSPEDWRVRPEKEDTMINDDTRRLALLRGVRCV